MRNAHIVGSCGFLIIIIKSIVLNLFDGECAASKLSLPSCVTLLVEYHEGL